MNQPLIKKDYWRYIETDGTPEKKGAYLVTKEDEVWMADWGGVKEGWSNHDYASDLVVTIYDVIAWQPIPSPARGEIK